MFYQMFRKLPPQIFAKMQPGGTKEFRSRPDTKPEDEEPWVKITMVHADHSSTCSGPNGVQMAGGNACGYVIHIPNHNFTIYYAGDTNIFSDMKIIDDLYKPDLVIMPVGDTQSLNARESAYAVSKFLPTPKTVVPMFLGVGKVGDAFDFAGYKKTCEEMDVKADIINCSDFYGGAAVVK